ncbi:MAG: SGNH/GDSL hydrolase family protein [Vicinamibacterales bacterium]
MILVTFALAAVACSKGDESPTSPSPNPSGGRGYTALGASDATGYGSSVPCSSPCTDGTGYVQLLQRQLEQNGPLAYQNIGVPGTVLNPAIEELSRRVGRGVSNNILTNQTPFVRTTDTIVTVFAGGNDGNIIAEAVRAQLGGDDPRAFIDQQVARWGEDYATVVHLIRQKAPTARIVLLNLPNLAAMPYVARFSTFEKSILQRVAVGLSDRVNALAAPNVHIVDLMCDARVIEPASFSADGFHPSDRGYALMAELAYPAMVNASHPAPAPDCGLKRLFPAY